MVDLKGRLVVVTGAASGIGRALVREFLREGGKVVALDRDRKALGDLTREAELLGFSVETVAADVGERRLFLDALERAAGAHGAPRVMVNNAGIARVGSFAGLGLDSFEETLRVNLLGVAYGTHFALSKMEPAGEGLIVNMASIAGHLPAAFMAAYSASKYAVVGFTRALQAELEMSGSPVRACLVSPGFVDTPIMKQENAPFPWYLRWLVAAPGEAARAIVRGVKEGRREIYPDPGGRLMKGLYRLAPGLTVKSSRLLLADSPSQLLGKAPIRPRP